MMKSWVSGIAGMVVVMGSRRVNESIHELKTAGTWGLTGCEIKWKQKRRSETGFSVLIWVIGANNCICELRRINQIEGKIMSLKCPWNVPSRNPPEGCETCKSRLEKMPRQEREI